MEKSGSLLVVLLILALVLTVATHGCAVFRSVLNPVREAANSESDLDFSGAFLYHAASFLKGEQTILQYNRQIRRISQRLGRDVTFKFARTAFFVAVTGMRNARHTGNGLYKEWLAQARMMLYTMRRIWPRGYTGFRRDYRG